MLLFTFVLSDSKNLSAQQSLEIESMDSKPYGKSLPEWTGLWWQWWLGMTHTGGEETHVFEDNEGKYCDRGQIGPVWFISATSRPGAIPTCDIPYGKSILVPILIHECSTFENPGVDLYQCTSNMAEGFEGLHLQYQDTRFNHEEIVKNFRVDNASFVVNFPDKDYINVIPVGLSNAAAAGYWVMFKPPAIGLYEIKFGGIAYEESINPIGPKKVSFYVDQTYRLNITQS